MFRQYHALKDAHPDAILFFRMGDFYEMFFRDAEVAAEELQLTLTARNKHKDPIPMAGVPHHAAKGYIQRLVDKGYRVAIAEQVEDPALAKGLVDRQVTRVITPGVVLDPDALEAKRPNYLVGLALHQGALGMAFLDVSTGDLRVTCPEDGAAAVREIHRMEPREAILSPRLSEEDRQAIAAALARHGALVSRIEDEAWRPAEGRREVCEALGVVDLRGFGIESDGPGVAAAGALLRYARDATGAPLGNVTTLRTYATAGFMVLDDTTLRNLEIHRTLIGGRRRGSLLGLVDKTATAMGSRLLREWLAFPLMDRAAISRRQSAVAAFADRSGLRSDLRSSLKGVADIERIVSRVANGTAGPRDLAALRRSLLAVPSVLSALEEVTELRARVPMDRCGDVAADLLRWLVESPPATIGEGGLIPSGVHEELDTITSMALDGVGALTRLETAERESTGIGSLKVRKNKVFGYYIEVTRANLHRVPERFMRKQTLSTCERFITPELKELEEAVLGADQRRRVLEQELFLQLRTRVGDEVPRLLELARGLGALDVLANLAEVAVQLRWVRPEVDDGLDIRIQGGRHPVVEAFLDEERFVPNDVRLGADRRLIVLTGPNMAGKSTVMRQVALIVLLAQVGSFVPADQANLGICDRIFTRVGASDDLARGSSTFMVEMAETAAILHHATDRSLVVLDEIGRGTSTYDGLAIAWSVAEALVDSIGCRGLFATHYHELCELAEVREVVANQSIAVREWGDRVLFLRKLKEGGASRSYGIQCARLAGLPAPVIERATALLTRFEKQALRDERDQLSLFGGMQARAVAAPEPEPPPPDPVRVALEELDPDVMTPRQALDAVYALKAIATDG